MPQRKGISRNVLSGHVHQQVRIKNAPSSDAVRQRAIWEALRDLGEVIYAIQCQDGAIKIGHTTNLQHRRSQHGVTFTDILAVVPGTYEQEQALHQRFHEHLARGREYYHPHPDVIDFVNEIRVAAGVQPIPLTDAT